MMMNYLSNIVVCLQKCSKYDEEAGRGRVVKDGVGANYDVIFESKLEFWEFSTNSHTYSILYVYLLFGFLLTVFSNDLKFTRDQYIYIHA